MLQQIYNTSQLSYLISPSIRIVGSYDICEAFYDSCSKYAPESEARPRKHKSIYSIGYATRPAIVLMKHFFDGEEYGLTRKIKLAKEIIEEHSYRLDIARTRTHAEKEEIFRLYNINKWSIRKIAKEFEIERGIASRLGRKKSHN